MTTYTVIWKGTTFALKNLKENQISVREILERVAIALDYRTRELKCVLRGREMKPEEFIHIDDLHLTEVCHHTTMVYYELRYMNGKLVKFYTNRVLTESELYVMVSTKQPIGTFKLLSLGNVLGVHSDNKFEPRLIYINYGTTMHHSFGNIREERKKLAEMVDLRVDYEDNPYKEHPEEEQEEYLELSTEVVFNERKIPLYMKTRRELKDALKRKLFNILEEHFENPLDEILEKGFVLQLPKKQCL